MNTKPKIAVLRSSTDLKTNRTGGAKYQRMVVEALSKEYDVRVYYLYYKNTSKDSFFKRAYNFAKMLMRLRRNNFPEDVFLLDRRTMFLCKKEPGKTYIGLTHHYNENDCKNLLNRLFLKGTAQVGFRKVDTLVSVSKYWKKQFENMGVKDVRVIYNAFEMKDFSNDELIRFRKKHNLLDERPIIYLGMNDENKGVVEVYEKLKDSDSVFVTSGLRKTHIPVLHLDLPYDDYLKLLSVSSLAVIMSKIPEGWSRVAHEAMLMRTPVIGSGTAGMAELLRGGGQIICDDLTKVSRMVEALLSDKKKMHKMAKRGYAFASKFTRERFNNDWLNLVQEAILCDRHEISTFNNAPKIPFEMS